MQQRSPEWFAERCGLATASRFKDVQARTKTGYASVREDYLAQLVLERLTNTVEPGFTTPAMQWGIDKEPEARMAYEAHTGILVEEVGFIRHDHLLAGASPDGLVGEDGLVEIKCPMSKEHLATLMNGMNSRHMAQVQGQMFITGTEFVDFVSYDPRFPESMRLYIQRIDRDEGYIDVLYKELKKFLDEVSETVEKTRSKYAKR